MKKFMKKLFALGICMMLFTLTVHAQSAELKFETKEYDFGTVQEDGGWVTTDFEFSNDGDSPLVINRVTASCGCATSDWTREPVPADGKGVIKVSFNPKGRPGPFRKVVTVRSNSSEKTVVLMIKGEVSYQTAGK